MLIKAKELKGYRLGARDGNIGKVEEFYFDDEHWTVRYLVADTGDGLSGRQVLISPYALSSIDVGNHSISVDLAKKQIELSPSLERHKPVSRQFEESYYGYYDWPMYGDAFYPWGWSPYPLPYSMEHRSDERENQKKNWDPHLRSTHAVTGYHIHARDGEIGHVNDFIIDDQTWTIRYLVVKTGNWFNGKSVLVSPLWVERVSWDDSAVFISLFQNAIRASPEFSERALISRDYEK
jgi:uncharacterized protein YrrD